MSKTLAGTQAILMFMIDLDAPTYTWRWFDQGYPLPDSASSKLYDSSGTPIPNAPTRVLSSDTPNELGAGVVTGGLSDGSMLGFINKLKAKIESHESVAGGERIPSLQFQLEFIWGGAHRLRMISWPNKRTSPEDGSYFPASTNALPAELLSNRVLTTDELGAVGTEGDVLWFVADCETKLKTAEGVA